MKKNGRFFEKNGTHFVLYFWEVFRKFLENNKKHAQNFAKILIFTKKIHTKFAPFFLKNLPFLLIFCIPLFVNIYF